MKRNSAVMPPADAYPLCGYVMVISTVQKMGRMRTQRSDVARTFRPTNPGRLVIITNSAVSIAAASSRYFILNFSHSLESNFKTLISLLF